MTRLIDADRMNAMLRHDNMIAGIVEEFIDDQPTVDAIPIWFIREQQDMYVEQQMYGCEAVLTALLIDWAERNKKEAKEV